MNGAVVQSVEAGEAILVTAGGSLQPPGPPILFVNAAFCALTGYAAEEVLGRSPAFLAGGETDVGELRRLQAALEQGRPADVTLVIYGKGDSPRRVEGSVTPVAGQLLCWLRPLGPATAAGADFEDMPGLLRSALECTFDAVLVVDSGFGTRFFNRKLLEMWKVPADLLERLDDRRTLEYALAQMRDPEDFLRRSRQLRDDPEAYGHDLIELKDGRVLERHSEPHRNAGRVIGRVFTYRDITRRQRAEQEVRRSEARLQALINALPATILRVDRSGRILDYHYGWGGLGAAHAKHLSELAPAPVVSRGMEALARALDTGASQTFEAELAIEGELRSYEATILRSGEDEAVAVVRDVTEHRRAEQRARARQRLETVGRLAGGMAQQYNNLLTRILGHASLLAAEFEGEATESVAEIIQAAREAASLTAQLLAYAGKVRMTAHELDLSQAVREAAAELPRRPGVELRLDLASDLPRVVGDSLEASQATRNLLLNAIEAVSGAGGCVSVRTEAVVVERDFADALGEAVAAGCYVLMTVADSGAGMDSVTRAHAFDPFFSTKFPGRGLGLAAVAGIMRAQRGGVLVDSEPGRGSTFRLYFPAKPTAGVSPR